MSLTIATLNRLGQLMNIPRFGQPTCAIGLTNSNAPPAAAATTGVPLSIASTITRPKGSGAVEVWATISQACINSGTWAWNPRNLTRSPSPNSSTRATNSDRYSSSPNRAPPTNTATTSFGQWQSASKRICCPFQGDNRLKCPTTKFASGQSQLRRISCRTILST
jgi:hypothetical protein